MAEQETSWLKDPQHWQIILGTLAKAAAGEHQQSWQAQLGGTMAQMGQAQKMAQAEEARQVESKGRWEQLMRLLGGETVTPATGEGAIPQAMMGELQPGGRATPAAPIAPRIPGMGLLGEEPAYEERNLEAFRLFDEDVLRKLMGPEY